MNGDLNSEFGRVDVNMKDSFDEGWRQDELGVIGAISRFVRYIGVLTLSTTSFLVIGAVYLFYASVSSIATATVMFVPSSDQFRNQALFDIDIETHSVLIESDEILSLVLKEAPLVFSGKGEGLAVSRINDIRAVLGRRPLTVTDEELLAASQNSRVVAGDTSESSALVQDPVLLSALRQRVDVERVGQSKLLNISFKAEDTTVAVTMANTIAETYSENSIRPNLSNSVSPANQRIQELLLNRGLGGAAPTAAGDGEASEQRSIQVVKLATLASVRSSPNVNVVLAVCVFLGLIVGLTISAALEYRKNKQRFEA